MTKISVDMSVIKDNDFAVTIEPAPNSDSWGRKDVHVMMTHRYKEYEGSPRLYAAAEEWDNLCITWLKARGLIEEI